MYLITPTLLNAFEYYFNFEGEASDGEDGDVISAEEKEAQARKEFLQTLNREKFPPTPAMQAGIDFENRVFAACKGEPDDSEVVRELAEICAGGHWQARVMAQMDGFLLYGKADVIKMDTIIDIKRTKSYDLGKYQKSAQHRIYLYCTKLPRFSYLVSDERSWWREDYFNHDGIEQEIRQLIRNFTSYLENDAEAKALFYDRWRSLEAQAA